jgi:hypothetical protein
MSKDSDATNNESLQSKNDSINQEDAEVNPSEAKNFVTDLGEKIEEFLASLERNASKHNKKS